MQWYYIKYCNDWLSQRNQKRAVKKSDILPSLRLQCWASRLAFANNTSLNIKAWGHQNPTTFGLHWRRPHRYGIIIQLRCVVRLVSYHETLLAESLAPFLSNTANISVGYLILASTAVILFLIIPLYEFLGVMGVTVLFLSQCVYNLSVKRSPISYNYCYTAVVNVVIR